VFQVVDLNVSEMFHNCARSEFFVSKIRVFWDYEV
jgi:hypothetical protein